MNPTDIYQVTPPRIDWLMASPVIAVSLAGILALIVLMFRKTRNNMPIVAASLVGLAVAAGLIIVQFPMPAGETMAGMVLRDRGALVLQLLLVGVCFLSILFSEPYMREKQIPFGEFYPLALWSTAGGMIMVATNNLLMLFIGLEVLSIALYVMAGMSRQEQKSEESALKYFLLGAFASAFLLYGIAFLYGATGGLRLEGIAAAWEMNETVTRNLIVFGVGLALIGLLFKAALVPFHQWTPDVYQGAPTNVTAFMAAGSKIAAIGALYRFLEACVPLRDLWLPALYWIAIATMLAGSLIALKQKDAKRALGYSSIANAGYILVAILAHLRDPARIDLGTTMFYLMVYGFMTIGVFAVVSLTARGGEEGTRFSDLHGLYRRQPFAVTMLIVLVVSLIGVPPTAGFFAKVMIIQDALQANMAPLAIVLVISSAISAYYYLQIIAAAFVNEEGATKTRASEGSAALSFTTFVCAVGVFASLAAAGPINRYFAPQREVQVRQSAPTPILTEFKR